MTVVKQADTIRATPAEMMNSKDFQQGFDEKRAGRAFRYDEKITDDWDYERGRQLATAAPRNMRLRIGGQLNPKAVRLFTSLLRKGAVT